MAPGLRTGCGSSEGQQGPGERLRALLPAPAGGLHSQDFGPRTGALGCSFPTQGGAWGSGDRGRDTWACVCGCPSDVPGMWRRQLEGPVSSAGEGRSDTLSTRWHLELWLVDSVDMEGARPGRRGAVWHLHGRRGWRGAAKRCPLARKHTASRGAQRQTTGLVQVPDR